jgi:hypothetical protein
MCGTEAKKKSTEARAIFKQVVKYLEEHNEIVIENIIITLEKDKEKSYVDDLKENRVNFKKSIKAHFEWMKDYAKIPLKQVVDINHPKYNIYVNSSLHLAYCDFYEEFFIFIEDIDKSKVVRSRLKKLTIALQKKYKCK